MDTCSMPTCMFRNQHHTVLTVHQTKKGKLMNCKINTDQDTKRLHCYDIAGPFSIKMDNWWCNTHQHSVDLSLAPTSVMPLLDGRAEPLILLPRTLLTQNLWTKIINMYMVSLQFEKKRTADVMQQNRNISMIVRNLQDDWYREYDRLVIQVYLCISPQLH